MVRNCILFTGEGGLFSSGISVPKPGLSMTTLPNLFSTTMALPASDPSGSSSATLAEASTVRPSFFLPLGHFALEMRAANSDRGDGHGDSHVFPLLARNEPAHESKRPFEILD